jgi:hypothetical protein
MIDGSLTIVTLFDQLASVHGLGSPVAFGCVGVCRGGGPGVPQLDKSIYGHHDGST